MRVSHASPALSAVFDDPNLVSCAGLRVDPVEATPGAQQRLLHHVLRPLQIIGVAGDEGVQHRGVLVVQCVISSSSSVTPCHLLPGPLVVPTCTTAARTGFTGRGPTVR